MCHNCNPCITASGSATSLCNVLCIVMSWTLMEFWLATLCLDILIRPLYIHRVPSWLKECHKVAACRHVLGNGLVFDRKRWIGRAFLREEYAHRWRVWEICYILGEKNAQFSDWNVRDRFEEDLGSGQERLWMLSDIIFSSYTRSHARYWSTVL